MLDFRLFRYALASAEHGSFRRAAAALNIQQSTVSRGVRTLEHRVGGPLFERSHAGIRPTPAGERFLQEAALGFDHLERATQRIGAMQRGEHGEVTVAASVPFLLFADAFERLRDEHPGVALEIVEGTCSGCAMMVQQRKAEVAFVSTIPGNGPAQSLHVRDERLVAVLPKSHRLADAPTVLLEELRAERFILGAGGLGPALADYLQRQLDAKLDQRLLRVGQCDLINMVARGFGATLAIRDLPHAAPDGVVFIPIADENTFPIHAIWGSPTANPSVTRLVNLAREARPITVRQATEK
ncbi:MAG: LysR family transcriptional regulator [Devosia sp.]|nr:LysR family transcriptional regulator [Devosia sp.]